MIRSRISIAGKVGLVLTLVMGAGLRGETQNSPAAALLPRSTLSMAALVDAEVKAAAGEKLLEARNNFRALYDRADKDDPWKVYAAIRYMEMDAAIPPAMLEHPTSPQVQQRKIEREPVAAWLETVFTGENKNTFLQLHYLIAKAQLQRFDGWL